MTYELWDTDSGNLIRSYSTLDEALALVGTAVTNHGRRYVSNWALVRMGDGGALSTIARGARLADRAVRPVPDRA